MNQDWYKSILVIYCSFESWHIQQTIFKQQLTHYLLLTLTFKNKHIGHITLRVTLCG